MLLPQYLLKAASFAMSGAALASSHSLLAPPAGQVIARISSPEYEAQLRGAQAEVLRAKKALAEAEALVSQRKSDQVLTKTDLERGQELVKKGWMTKQVFDQRVDKAESADANLRAAVEQVEAAKFAIQTAQAEVERIDAILVDLTLISPRSGRVQYLIQRLRRSWLGFGVRRRGPRQQRAQ